MKQFGVLAFAIVAALCISKSQGINSTYGSVGPYDRLLHREFVVMKPQFFRVITRDVEYPPKGYKALNLITAVRALDQSRGGKGGYATLMRGGPGFRNVTLHLKSVRYQGLNFTVEIYGR